MKKVLKKFGKYLLLDRLAQGGMAEIYRAWAPSVDGGGRLIVMKCVQSSFGEDPEFLQMFRSEIRVTMGLNHPNIVQLYDFGEENGQPFIAMELVDGKNLKQFTTRVFQKTPQIAPEYAAYIISQAAAGLHFAHTYKDRTSGKPLNIIHRDISPQNLLISYEGNVKIIDFGIAKAASNRQATRAGIIKGKPSYLSPEQIDGVDLDGRSDVFSLGAVLWETLTGKKLFSGDSDLAAIRMIEECDKTVTPPSRLNPLVPQELDMIVLKSLTKDREKRFKTAEEMQRALHRFVYAYKPGFDPADFANYFKGLFKTEIEEEQRTIQALNAEAKELFAQVEAEKVNEGSQSSQSNEESSDASPTRKQMQTFSAVAVSGVEVDYESSGKIHRPTAADKRAALGETRRPPGSARSQSTQAQGQKKAKLIIPIILVGLAAYLYGPDLMKQNGSVPRGAPKQVETAQNPPKPATPVAQAAALLKLDIIPSGGNTQIQINHQTIDANNLRVPAGVALKLEILKDGFKPYERDISAPQGMAELPVQASLEPATYGTLTLHSTPTAEARIFSNGMTWSRPTPIDSLRLPPGEYQIQLTNQLLGMQKQVILTIEQDKSVHKEVNLDLIK